MILRRLAEGIKNQDWFVVVVEILIEQTGRILTSVCSISDY